MFRGGRLDRRGYDSAQISRTSRLKLFRLSHQGCFDEKLEEKISIKATSVVVANSNVVVA